MLKVVTLLWDANEESYNFSRCYNELWVERLYDGFKRNLTVPYEFMMFTDRPREIDRDVTQVFIQSKKNYGACIEPYKLNDPMILVGLDTIIVGNIDHLAEYCLKSEILAVPHDPYHFPKVCNGVALVPAGHRYIYDEWNGENDMEWIRQQRYKVLDLLFPGHVVGYKTEVKPYGLRDARIVFFHGHEKPHECVHLPWVQKHWLGRDEEEAPPEGFVLNAPVAVFCNTQSKTIEANVKENAKRDLPWLSKIPEHEGHAVLVGGGPSVVDELRNIRSRQANGQTIFALNNAANFLKEHGIIPDYQLVLDARPENARFVENRPARKYLIGSQCHPDVFEELSGADVMMFHHGEDWREYLPKETSCLTGAYVLGPIAMSAAFVLGFRNMHLYGYDSSDAEDGSAHAYDQNETDPEKKRVEVIVAGRPFRCSFGMYKQAEVFPYFAATLANHGCTITVHGDGLLPTIAREMMKTPNGIPPSAQQENYDARV